MNHLGAKTQQAVKAAELRWLVKLYAVSFAVLGAVAPYFALELQARGASGVTLALSLGSLPLVRLVAGPLWGLLADWLQGSKRVLVLGATITFLATAILAYEDLPPRITPLVMALWALGRAPMGPIVDAMALSALGDDQGAYGKLRRWGSVGFLVAAFASGALRDWFGLSPLVFGWGLSSLVLWIVLDTPTRKTPQRVALWPALVAMGKDRVVRCLLIGSAFHFAGHIGSTSFLAVHMEGLGLSSQWVGVALAVGVGVEVVVLSYS